MKVVTLAAMSLACWSCVNDDYDSVGVTGGNAITMELSIQTRAVDEREGYEIGNQYENYIDIAGGDYRIYLFTNDKDDAAATTDDQKNTLIAEFIPDDIYSNDSGSYTTYFAFGEVDPSVVTYTDFKVVMLANWGTYPEVTAGETTIDDVCNAESAIFTAFVDNSGNATVPSEDHLVPFYGVREYSGVVWRSGLRTNLDGAVSLLRAVAKVEVIVENGLEDAFENVVLRGYNALGYCAPGNVYLRGDYEADGYTNWGEYSSDKPHLVSKDASGNGINDPDQSDHTITFLQTTNSDGLGIWYAYIPEYDNSGDDYCYISGLSKFQFEGEEPHNIYFGNYTDGSTDAYDEGGTAQRFDIFRGSLYRFYVTLAGDDISVSVESWEDVIDNEWDFGEMSHVLEVGDYFSESGIRYEVMLVEEDESATDNYGYRLEVWITRAGASYTGDFYIPEKVTYLGYDYTVTGIEQLCFEADTELVAVHIPATVVEVGGYAFALCSNLESIYIQNPEPPQCDDGVFYGDDVGHVILYVPVGCAQTYAEHEIWGAFDIQEINYGD